MIYKCIGIGRLANSPYAAALYLFLVFTVEYKVV